MSSTQDRSRIHYFPSEIHIGSTANNNGSLRLPFEILQAIFLKGNHSRKTIIKLSRVCRLWRSIINHTMELWTTIRPFSLISKNLDDAKHRIEWLVQRTLRARDHGHTKYDCNNGGDGEDNGVLLDVVWDTSSYMAIDSIAVATYFFLLVPPTRWRSLHASIGKISSARILEEYYFPNLGEMSISGSRSIPGSLRTENDTNAKAESARSLKTFTVREYDDDVIKPLKDLQLIGPSTRVRFESGIPLRLTGIPEAHNIFFNQIRRLYLLTTFPRAYDSLFQHITEFHVGKLNPFRMQTLQMPHLKRFSIDTLWLYDDAEYLIIHLPSVEELELRKASGTYGRVCHFDAPLLQKLHLGRPEKRLLDAFRRSRYSHLTLGLHIYWDRALELVRPYFGNFCR